MILKVKYNIKALYKEKTLVYMSAYHPPPWCSCSSPPMMMFDGAGDSTDYLGAVFIIVSISAGGGAGAGAPWDRHIRRYEHRTHRHKRYPSGG